MLSFRLRHMKDVVAWDLCVGCGACIAACDKNAVTIENWPELGIRAKFAEPECSRCNECLSICPGRIVEIASGEGTASCRIGPVLAVYEGWATDNEVRHSASSGGLLSAISLYCLEREGMDAVYHVGPDPELPWLTKPAASRTREEILENCSSRYAPASPCVTLKKDPADAASVVFVGKPCDVAAARALVSQMPDSARNVELMLSFCCAGTPSTNGTLDVISSLGSVSNVRSIRYRGMGWPGRFSVECDRGTLELSYEESWAMLSKYRAMRCHQCPDGLGYASDITCGDAWHRIEEAREGKSPGRSIAIVRTERGRQILESAAAAGYVELEAITEADVLRAQAYLVNKQRRLYGRLLAMSLFGIPTTSFRGFDLLRSWISLPPWETAKSIVGTAVRIIRRRLWRKVDLTRGGR